jgi:hypothetical protein
MENRAIVVIRLVWWQKTRSERQANDNSCTLPSDELKADKVYAHCAVDIALVEFVEPQAQNPRQDHLTGVAV